MSAHTLRTHVVRWRLGEKTGSFEVDSYPGEDYAAAADDYLAEYVGTDAEIVAIERKP